MKGTTTAVTMLMPLVLCTTALAANGAESEGLSLLTLLFIGFFALIVVMQLIPGLSLLVSMLAGIFSSGEEKAEKATTSLGKD